MTFHFEQSLSALAEVVLRETNATGYAIFQKTLEAPGLARIAARGTEIPGPALLEQTDRAVVTFPLHAGGPADGFIAFSFADEAAAILAGEPLSRTVEAIEAVWAARHLDARYFRLVRRLSILESQLIDSKIADRARGILADSNPNPDILDSLVRHVHTVLRPSSVSLGLENLLRELEEEIEERRVTGQAKALLETAHGLSEEQAYLFLRTQSRKSRRRLKDIARDVIAKSALIPRTA